MSPEIPQIEEPAGLGPSVWRAEPPRGVSSLGSFQRDPQPPLLHCSGAATPRREELDSSVLLCSPWPFSSSSVVPWHGANAGIPPPMLQVRG